MSVRLTTNVSRTDRTKIKLEWTSWAWGEASEDVHLLVHDLATSWAMHQQLLEGRQRWSKRSEEAEVVILMGQVRGMLSIERVRSQARCLIEWLRGPSAGASPAPRRWQWVSHEEQRFGRERMAHLISLVQGHHALRQGQFPLWFLTISHFYSALEVMYVSQSVSQSVSGHYWCDSGEYFDLHPVWINVSKLKKNLKREMWWFPWKEATHVRCTCIGSVPLTSTWWGHKTEILVTNVE